MRQTMAFAVCVLLAAVLSSSVSAAPPKKGVDLSKKVVVVPFDSAVKGAAGLPEATRASIIQTMKDGQIFAAVLTPEEAKDADKGGLVELSGRLVDFEQGNAAKRLMVGFGSGRAHAGFEFTLKDATTGEVLWHKTIKQTASFWFNSSTSSAAERAELPDGLAKKLVNELQKDKAK